MKIKNILIFLLMIIVIMTALNIKTYATTGKINSDTVRLRKEPSTESDILEQLDLGDEVEILEEADGWYKAVYTNDENKKITGYISASLLDVEQDESQTNNNDNQEQNNEETNNENSEEVSTQNPVIEEPHTEDVGNNIEENAEYTINKEISVKILPLMNSKEIGIIANGTVKVVEIINDWCRIENDNEIGWIRKNVLRKSTIISENTSTETNSTENDTSTAENDSQNVENLTIIKTAYVSADSLKVRKEPNTTSEVIDSLTKNSQVSITEQLDGWYQIKIGEQIGYVSSEYISDTRVQETTSRSSSTKRGETVQTSTTSTTENSAETTNTATSATGEAVVAYAKQYLGYKYVAGGASPSTGFDCSGFTQYVYKHFGITLNRVSRDQSKNGVAVDKANLQPGDILLFKGSSGSAIGHVGIYIGGGQFIHAENPSTDVCITSMSSNYYTTRYVGARRVI